MKKTNPPKAKTQSKNPLLCPKCGATRDIASAGGRLVAKCPNCDKTW